MFCAVVFFIHSFYFLICQIESTGFYFSLFEYVNIITSFIFGHKQNICLASSKPALSNRPSRNELSCASFVDKCGLLVRKPCRAILLFSFDSEFLFHKALKVSSSLLSYLFSEIIKRTGLFVQCCSENSTESIDWKLFKQAHS